MKMGFKGAIFLEKHNQVISVFSQLIGATGLDYGCGNGFISDWMAKYNPYTHINAYDGPETGAHYDYKAVLKARHITRNRENITILDTEPGQYDSVILMCMLHGNHGIMGHAMEYLNPGGNLLVFDHDKSHLTKSGFDHFLTDADIAEIRARGYDATRKDHTRMTIDDCLNMGKDLGLRTEIAWDHTCALMDGYPFYIWSGRQAEVK